VLFPLPVRPRTVLFAKLAAAGAVAGLGVLVLNFPVSLAVALLIGGFARSLFVFLAYWFTLAGSAALLLASVLTVQGFTALLLPRRAFIRLSAVLQLAAFALLIAVYFLEPSLLTPAAFQAPANRLLLASSPQFWFFALFHQLIGQLPPGCAWLAGRAWAGLGIVLAGALASLLLCYLRTMRKTVEEPDLLPAARGSHWTLPFGSRLQTAILQFSVRSLLRSRQHRVALAFYLGIGAALTLLILKQDGPLIAVPHPLLPGFLFATFTMMTFAVVGLRSVYALPISLTANWVLRTTQLAPPELYIAATRRSLLLFAALPVWLASALYGLTYRPLYQVAEHLVILALLAVILADLNLIGFYKVPFTCSYLPGKSNVQVRFWAFVIVFVPLATLGAMEELRAFPHLLQTAALIAFLAAAAACLRVFNRRRFQPAVLYFEELPEEILTTLHLVTIPPPISVPSPRP